MARTLTILVMATTAIATSYAGSLTINPGNVLGPNGTVYVGLLPANGSPNPVNGNGASGVTTGNPDSITVSGTNFAQRNTISLTAIGNTGTIGTSTNTNSNSTHTGPLLSGLPDYNPNGSNPTCSSNCQDTIYTPTAGPTFNLLGDGTNADTTKNSNIWYSLSTGTGAGASTINIPVGVFGVASVDTMLNTVAGNTTGGTICANPANCAGSTGAAYATITFTFQDANDFRNGVSAGEVTETLALINGVTQRNVLGGVGGSASTISSSYTAYDLSASGPSAGASYTVQTGNEWNGIFSAAGSGGTPAVNSTMLLDYQIFPIFSSYQNDYLVSISITDTGAASTNREILSGITVNTTPEPSTLTMLLIGFGAICFVGLRRRLS